MIRFVRWPKGTGKSSIIRAVYENLKEYYSVKILVEKELDLYRNESKQLLTDHKESLNKDVEVKLLHLLAKGRYEIGKKYIQNSNFDIILMDRWYPSDGVFRLFHSFEECLKINLEHHVIQPDIVIATVCDPEISFQRALTRSDGLRSLVIDNFQDHVESTNRFHQVALDQNWFVLNTEKSINFVTELVIEKLKGLL
ncbi:hypothetical protein RCG23_03360 [Neobacillus sp. PS3-34]|uniref:hypothetical protein n=1 Tax=Neobacillus sp. PS3-34 TaxID=3070678 RepID=UPI0027DFFEEF|nr:hypothetical protein [Neobacillus sp. PS3-34]WML50507.1 hypothetical protein RCG23_03360 [Neobacillus sp. PS3-34]